MWRASTIDPSAGLLNDAPDTDTRCQDARAPRAGTLATLSPRGGHGADRRERPRQSAAADRTSRIVGLDAWRAVLLLGGPLVHSIAYGHSTASLEMIGTGSYLFRMAAFFAIAGFTGAMTMAEKRSGWLANRARQLVVPLCSMMLVVWMIRRATTPLPGHLAYADRLFPGHLWFLMSLIAITPAMLVTEKLGINARLVRWIDDHVAAFLGFMSALACASSIAPVYLAAMLHPLGTTLSIVLLSTVEYAVFYLLGFLICRSESCRAWLRHGAMMWTGPAIWAATMIVLTCGGALSVPHAQFLGTLLTGLTGCWMSVTVLASAVRITRISPAVKALSDASYSVYLFHFPIALVLAMLVPVLLPTLNPYLLYLLIVSVCTSGSLALHAGMSRSAGLLFLFNGRKMNWSASSIVRHVARAGTGQERASPASLSI